MDINLPMRWQRWQYNQRMPKYGWQLNLQFPNNTGRNFPFAIFIGKKYNRISSGERVRPDLAEKNRIPYT